MCGGAQGWYAQTKLWGVLYAGIFDTVPMHLLHWCSGLCRALCRIIRKVDEANRVDKYDRFGPIIGRKLSVVLLCNTTTKLCNNTQLHVVSTEPAPLRGQATAEYHRMCGFYERFSFVTTSISVVSRSGAKIQGYAL